MGSPGSNINALMNLFQQSHLTTPIQDPPTSNATMGAFAGERKELEQKASFGATIKLSLCDL